ncbi:MAG: DUF3798 domain-containing protein [Christensenellales bacterium]|jgi:hypothetical protein
MKKLLSVLLIAMLLLSAFGAALAEAPAEGNWKIAVLTGTTSQGEEEFRAAEKLKELYGDRVVTDTYPDNFASEQEVTIGKLEAFAQDPDVKAIIIVQGVQGVTAAYTKIREIRPDILLIVGVPAEDPWMIAPVSDIVFQADEISMGPQIIDTLVKWDVDVFVHYSFARHLGYESIANRLAIFQELCELEGIELVQRDAPDPSSEGAATAQQFILEDVPLVMQEYAGKKVGFFTTNCGMQVALQMAILDQDAAFYPLPCCPSPFHGFPEAFGITANAEDYADMEGYIGKLAAFLDEHGAIGRYSTWAVPVNMSMIYGSAEYAMKYIAGETNGKLDEAVLTDCLSSAAGVRTKLTYYEDADGKTYDNFFMVFFDNIDFADYLK